MLQPLPSSDGSDSATTLLAATQNKYQVYSTALIQLGSKTQQHAFRCVGGDTVPSLKCLQEQLIPVGSQQC